MSQQAQTRNTRAGMRRAQGRVRSMERYRRSQGLARNGTRDAAGRAHPLEFDESGFPIAQSRPSFVERVARLLSPS
jgi:hypothetical protein